MNVVLLSGRLTREPEISYTKDQKCIARFTIAIDRDKDNADFIPVKVFGKTAELTEKFLKKGSKVIVSGRIVTGSYDNKEGKKVFTQDVIGDRVEFLDSKPKQAEDPKDEFVNIPDNVADEGLPFN